MTPVAATMIDAVIRTIHAAVALTHVAILRIPVAPPVILIRAAIPTIRVATAMILVVKMPILACVPAAKPELAVSQSKVIYSAVGKMTVVAVTHVCRQGASVVTMTAITIVVRRAQNAVLMVVVLRVTPVVWQMTVPMNVATRARMSSAVYWATAPEHVATLESAVTRVVVHSTKNVAKESAFLLKKSVATTLTLPIRAHRRKTAAMVGAVQLPKNVATPWGIPQASMIAATHCRASHAVETKMMRQFAVHPMKSVAMEYASQISGDVVNTKAKSIIAS